jgi:hypothetical protein
MIQQELTEQQRQAVEQHGFLELESAGSAYVLMSMQVYRDMMGVGSEAEYQASLAAVREGLADVEAGRTQPAEDFFREFDRRHGIED